MRSQTRGKFQSLYEPTPYTVIDVKGARYKLLSCDTDTQDNLYSDMLHKSRCITSQPQSICSRRSHPAYNYLALTQQVKSHALGESSKINQFNQAVIHYPTKLRTAQEIKVINHHKRKTPKIVRSHFHLVQVQLSHKSQSVYQSKKL